MRKQGKTTKQPTGRKERKEKAEVLKEHRKAMKATRKVTRNTYGAKKGRTAAAEKTH